MKKALLVLFLTAAICGLAFAQTGTTNKTNTVTNMKVVNPGKDLAKSVDENALLRAQVARLKLQVQLLKSQVNQLMADAQKAKENQPHCSADLKTSMSGQGSRDCWPNACDVVTGTCLQACVTSNDCQAGTACWIDEGAVNGQCRRTQ